MQIKMFESFIREKLEAAINVFLDELNTDQVVDIKMHCDPQVDPEWEGILPAYVAMVIYKRT